jgi:hypothetical protein
LERRIHEHIPNGAVGYLAGGILVVDSYRVDATIGQLVVAAIYGDVGNRDVRVLNKDLRGYGVAEDVRTIGSETSNGRYHHRGVTGAAYGQDADQGQVLVDHDLLGVNPGTHVNRSTGRSRRNRCSNGGEMNAGLAGADDNCGRKRLAAQCDKHKQRKARKCESTARVHLVFSLDELIELVS